MAIAPYKAAAELTRRQRARASLVDFSQSIDVPGVPIADVPDVEEGRHIIETERPVYKTIESRVALHHLLIMQAIQTMHRDSKRSAHGLRAAGLSEMYVCICSGASLGYGAPSKYANHSCFLRYVRSRASNPAKSDRFAVIPCTQDCGKKNLNYSMNKERLTTGN